MIVRQPVKRSALATHCCARNGSTRPLPTDLLNLNQDELRVRKGHLLTLLATSSTSLFRRIRDGEVPPPDGHDAGRAGHPSPYWRAETIRNFLKKQKQSGQ